MGKNSQLSEFNKDLIIDNLQSEEEIYFKSSNYLSRNFDSSLDTAEKIYIKSYTEIDSTNNEAKRFIEYSESDLKMINKSETNEINENKYSQTEADSDNNFRAAVFAADKQLQGRGRRGRRWLSESKDSLSISLLFRVAAAPSEIPQITAAAALAVKNTFERFNLNTEIKWPNDILAGSKKIAGILSELVFSEDNTNYIIIGCGINLNNSELDESINSTATSYYMESGSREDKNLFAAVLIYDLYNYVEKYFEGSRRDIINRWKEELEIKGQKALLLRDGKSYNVIIRNVLDDGAVLAELKDGSIEKFHSFNTSYNYINQ